MPDLRFFENFAPKSIAETAVISGAALFNGSSGAMLTCVASCRSEGRDDDVIYCDNEELISLIKSRKFGLCLTTEKLANKIPGNGAIAVSPNPKAEVD